MEGRVQRAAQKSLVYAGTGVDSIQSNDDRVLQPTKRKREEWESDCLCHNAETGSRYLWRPEIR